MSTQLPTVTDVMKKAIKEAYLEWAEQQVHINSSKETQADIVESVAEKFDLSKSDVAWMFKTQFTDKIDEATEKFETKAELHNMIF